MTQTSKETIKYRVIGALVIVISLSLAWWLLLDHDVRRLQDNQQGIPKPIKIKRISLPEETPPQPKTLTDAAKTAQEAQQQPPQEPEPIAEPVQEDEPAPKARPKKTKASEKPETLARLNSQGLPEAWVLQVASFKHQANANSLKDKLLAKDFPAYVKVFNLPEGKVYRVLLGPKLSKDKAKEMAKSVEKAFSIKTMLMAYQAGFAQ